MRIKHRQAFIIGIKSLSLSLAEIKFIKRFKPWGIILFSRNIKSFDQTLNLTKSIKKIFKDKNYPILIDQEGGKVDRLKNILDSKFFSAYYFGEFYKKSRKQSIICYNNYIDQVSYLLTKLGITINTVPVLDLLRDKTSKVIGSRSFSKNINIINLFGKKTIARFHRNKIATVMKHIPGHGLGYKDSHFKLPVVKKSKKFLLNNDFKIFKNKKCLFAMTAHIMFKDFDSKFTVTHSEKLINVIRSKIKFSDLIITDDISMKALPYNLKINTQKAFTAGCDIVLHCNANLKEMKIVAMNSPKLNKFVINKTKKYYKLVS